MLKGYVCHRIKAFNHPIIITTHREGNPVEQASCLYASKLPGSVWSGDSVFAKAL